MEISQRPFHDIESLSQKVLQGHNFSEELEQFAKFSEELKDYLIKKTDNQEVLNRLKKLPLIDYEPVKPQLVDYIPIYGRYRTTIRQKATEIALEQVHEIRSIYGSILFLLKAE